ncbi:hypothetical protein RHAL1_02404 [Beijerinckiaceae bacterium RH AL1]|nr:metallophosphoesterase [Beijerinckiaceae bacterium]VVB46659.1 hypothetical protein RHCH11_RHCH11_02358 [Beijerinckiaceae bacterium RH CH11]VVB46743.1 hypothetical protein RHAL8_02354 [Beijerinckiaceae bacterium RH AL8]VVC55486.1 hypothetical protein RHAL1_02404 [Beijerinckiaceae bacterium RH AL1]
MSATIAPTHRPRQPGASLAHKEPPRLVDKTPIPAQFTPRAPLPYRMDLADIIGAEKTAAIAKLGRMSIHCVGDTGGIKRPEAQHLVARGMEDSANNPSTTPVSFFYHLGDVVYYTGEVPDYWDQFYEPYEHYPLSIVGIPGNHDGEMLTRESISLLGFYENFCAEAPGTFTHESRDSHRAALNQPFFYWTLVTPVATFIGLYTNVPEHGYIDDDQRAWFHKEMAEAAKDKALIVALHHPVYSFDDHHSGSSTMGKELQDAINATKRVPNMVLSAHVHDYQRIELDIGGRTIPFFVIGNGGYWNLHHLAAAVGYQDPETEAKLVSGVDTHHGFMTFEIGRTVINGNFTTVPRPQDSWSDPKAYNMKFDVFSYTARAMFLGEGESVTLVPDEGSHLPPHHGQGGVDDGSAGQGGGAGQSGGHHPGHQGNGHHAHGHAGAASPPN